MGADAHAPPPHTLTPRGPRRAPNMPLRFLLRGVFFSWVCLSPLQPAFDPTVRPRASGHVECYRAPDWSVVSICLRFLCLIGPSREYARASCV
eukprot:296318-Prorocentrum_minimum.AAC.1